MTITSKLMFNSLNKMYGSSKSFEENICVGEKEIKILKI